MKVYGDTPEPYYSNATNEDKLRITFLLQQFNKYIKVNHRVRMKKLLNVYRTTFIFHPVNKVDNGGLNIVLQAIAD